jgi:hypothetical protein
MTDLVKRAAERVSKGVKFLDKKHPGWRQRINWRTFDFNKYDKCIIGQLGLIGELGFQFEQDHGFELPHEDVRSDVMQKLWLRRKPKTTKKKLDTTVTV